jgi:transcriptional regulator with XRE-family HTH domain
VKKELASLGRTYIAEWRESRDMTQEELAEGINMSRSTLSKIETADSPYTQRTLEAIASVLKCKPYDLLREPQSVEQKSPVAALRSAMIAYGIDHKQLDLALGVVDQFVTRATSGEQSERNPSDGQSAPATRHRESTP